MKHVAAMRAVVIVATISFAGVVAAIVVVMATSYAAHLRETQADIVRAAPRLYAQARPGYDSPERTLAAAFHDLPTDGWRLHLAARPPDFEGPPPGAPPPADADPTPMGALAALIGVVPRRVPLIDATLDVVPDLARFAHAVQLVAIAVLLVLAFGGATLWRFSRRCKS